MTLQPDTIDLDTAARCTFGPLEIRFDERVLEPRPWTLMQSSWAAELAADVQPGAILELCAGAGHIGLAAAALCGRPLVQVEASPVAAAFAQHNADVAQLPHVVELRCLPMEQALGEGERFPVVLADPPYLPTADVHRWPGDPVSAIDGGADGLDLVRTCVRIAAAHLHDDGVLLLQVAGSAQADAVAAWLADDPQLGLTHRRTRSVDDDRAVMLLTR